MNVVDRKKVQMECGLTCIEKRVKEGVRLSSG